MTDRKPIDFNGKCERCGKEWKTQRKPERFCSMACKYGL